MVSANHDSALMFLHRAVDLAEKTKSPHWISEAQLDFVNWYTNYAPDKDSALYLCRNWLNRMTLANYHKGMAVSAGWMGRIYLWYSLDSAIYYDWKSIEYFKIAKDSFGMAITQSNLANVYAEAGNNVEAIRVGLGALEYAKRINFKSLIYNSCINIGEYYQRTGQLKEAEKYTLESYNYIDSTPTNIAYYNWEMANIRFLSGNYTEAKKLYSFVAETGVKNTLNDMIALGYDGLAKIAEVEKNWNDVIKYKSIAWQHAEKNRNNSESYNEMLYKAHDAKGNYKEALVYYKNYVAVRDSYDVASRLKQVDVLEKQFKAREKQAKIDLLEKDKQLQEAETVSQKRQRNMLALLFALAALAGAFAFSRFHQKAKQKQEAERARISRDLHDDIGATLGSISIYSEVAKNKADGNTEMNEVLFKIGDSSREMLEKINDIVWAVNPKNDNASELIPRMKNFAAAMLTSRGITFEFTHSTIPDSGLQLEMLTRKNIFLVYKEALHNIVKYSHAGSVGIDISLQNKKLVMTIQDNGIGFRQNSDAYNGNGIKNMKQRAEEAGATLEIRTEVDKGTRINLSVPV